MAILIFSGAILFTLIGLGVGAIIFYCKAYAFNNITPCSLKLKIGSFVLILINTHSLATSAIPLLTSSGTIYDIGAALQSAFFQIFSLAIILLYIFFGIFLLLKNSKFSVIASACILIFTTFRNVFLTISPISYFYVYYLFIIAILISIIIVLAAINGKADIFYRHSKLIKASPYLIFLRIINTVISLFSSPRFSLTILKGFAWVILEFVAYWLILNALVSLVPKRTMDSCKTKTTKKESILIILSFLIFPAILYLVSSIDKTWLFVGAVVLAIFLPIALILASSKKSKIIAALVTLAIVVALCFVAKILPKNDEKFDPNKCYWCEGMGFYMIEEGGDLYRCSHCHGTGRR